MHIDHIDAGPAVATTAPGPDPVTGQRLGHAQEWVTVCPLRRITADTGVAAWVAGHQVAVFRLADGSLHAVDNRDPASGANVLARGIVGDSAERPVVASPLYKERYDLVTGACLDDPSLHVRTWDVRLVDDQVAVRVQAG